MGSRAHNLRNTGFQSLFLIFINQFLEQDELKRMIAYIFFSGGRYAISLSNEMEKYRYSKICLFEM